MDKDYIEIAGTGYRIECNWNAIQWLCDLKGIKDLAKLDRVGELSPSEMAEFLWVCIQQGAACDGVTLQLTREQLMPNVRASHMIQFSTIFKAQMQPSSSGQTPGKDVSKKKIRRILFFRRRN